MEGLIENIKVTIWTVFHNIRMIKLRLFVGKSLFCRLGFHNMKRGVGWSGDKRFDVCLRKDCCYSKWYNDKIGNDLIDSK